MTETLGRAGGPESSSAVRRHPVINTPPDNVFDRLTALTARLLGVPIAMVSVTNTDRIWLKSHHGLDVDQVSGSPGLYVSAILHGEPWIADDAGLDPGIMANPLVAEELGLRFHAQVPLRTRDGHDVGSLCVMDKHPRQMTEKEIDTLRGMAGLVTDELELRRAARTTVSVSAAGRKAAEMRFRTAFERSPVGLSLQSPEGRFLMVNPALCEMLGRTEIDLRQMTWADVCHPDVFASTFDALGEMLSGRTESMQTETRWLRRDGEVVWVLMNVSLVLDPNGDPDYFFSQVEDVTSIRRGEMRTRSIAELRRKALAGMAVGALTEEAVDSVITGLNLECAMVHTLTSPGDLCVTASAGCPSDLPVRGEEGAEAERSHALYTLEKGEAVVVRDLGGETRFVPPPHLVGHGFVSGMSVVIRVEGRAHGVLAAYSNRARQFSASDLDFLQGVAELLGRAVERREHDEAQRRLHEQERLAAVGQLAAGVAHDFNNIIIAVGLYAELLELHQRLDDAGRGHLAAIQQQVERATALVWQILDFAHRSPLEVVDVDLLSFLAGLMPVLHGTLPDGVDLGVVGQAGPYVVRGDPTRLQQILLNLVTNAADALEGSGELTITLSVHGPPPDAEPLDEAEIRQWVRIDVTDTGRGMAPDVLARVFEPFFTTKPAGGGTGLGLSQVHRLVAQHAGHIEVESSPERGTTVSIWLPAASRIVTAEERVPVEIHWGRGQRLAVVDDDPAVRSALAQVLESLGYVVMLAADGGEVLTMLEREPASLSGVVSDVLLPGIGGEELARLVAERWPDVAVVLISGYRVSGPHGEPVPDGSPEGHACRVIRMAKPFTRGELAGALRLALSHDALPERSRNGRCPSRTPE